LDEIWKDFERLGFGGGVQRRGTHVKLLERGSRDGRKCFWGNLGFYAVLRREMEWRVLDLVGFEVWAGVHVGGGSLMCFKEFIVLVGGGFVSGL
jgi:hypothetical protein